MPTRKIGKLEPIRTIEVRTDEISVVKNRFSEPYIKSFVAAPENITQKSLGTLVGVFSVSDHSESSGFVVNVLVSAIRKEYFANSKRGVIESFEAALHKMNLALSELVKNGQTRWIGNLHGAVAAIEKNNIHFSATGFGRVLLFRGGALSDIGKGLAPEEASIHPLKTFVEISSGRLNAADCVLLASPEIFELFTDDELERSARRLIPDQKFLRFLKTAMTNDLRQGSAIVLSVEEHLKEAAATKTEQESKRRAQKKIENIFSETAFKETFEKRAEIFQKETPVVTILEEPESKTRFGDIYVRGEEPKNHAEHPFITRFRWISEDAITFLRNLIQRAGEQLRQRWEAVLIAVSDNISMSLSKVKLIVRSAIHLQPKTKKAAESEPEPRETKDVPTQKKSKWKLPDVRMPELRIQKIALSRTKIFIFRFISDFVIPMSKNVGHATNVAAQKVIEIARTSFDFLKRKFLALPPKRQLIIASISMFALTLGSVFLWNSFTKEKTAPIPVVITKEPIQVFPPEDEPKAILASPDPVGPATEDIISPVFLRDSLYLITRNSIYDTENNTTIPVPSGNVIRLAAGMDDLRLIFLITEENRIFAFAPSNRSFVENSLKLPSRLRPAGIGTFLTYLYVLEEGTGRIYRFPRAEGGFGEGITWTKDPMNSGTKTLAISDRIYSATDTDISAFFRGRQTEGFSLETTASPLFITALCANNESVDRFVIVDARKRRIVVLRADGQIVAQYFHESFTDATACSLSRDGKTIAISIGKDASLIRLTE